MALTVVSVIRDESLSCVWCLTLKPQHTQKEDGEFEASWDYISETFTKRNSRGKAKEECEAVVGILHWSI